MTRMRLTVEDDPDAALLLRLEEKLVTYNTAVSPPEEFGRLAVFLHDDDRLVAGVSGFTHWSWLFVEHLWVDTERRRSGLGSEVLDSFEHRAFERGARAARVCTYSFQAPRFYEHMGYRQFAVLDDYPPGYRLHFFAKQLGPG